MGVGIMSITKPFFLNLQFLSFTVNYPAKNNVTHTQLDVIDSWGENHGTHNLINGAEINVNKN